MSAQKWMPISTAPRDGTIILATHIEDPEVVFSVWFEQAPADRCFYSAADQMPCEPSHWMPMFEPPAVENAA